MLNCASQIAMKSYLQESGSAILITYSFDLVKRFVRKFCKYFVIWLI